MKPSKFLAATAFAFLSACVPKPKPSPAVIVPMPKPTPAPVVSAPSYANWMDAPATPGNWSYRMTADGGIAQFSTPSGDERFAIRCDRPSSLIAMTRSGNSVGLGAMTIRTESQTRVLAPSPLADALPAAEVRLSAVDRLLDAMALSKGRFAVEVAGRPPLYLPSWAEVTRVIEDCR